MMTIREIIERIFKDLIFSLILFYENYNKINNKKNNNKY